ncbi:Solute carrier family 22 member 6 [Portunus trituberculatus]|uniref:Solute carrier family 22 member 6 n=1 Tax=Portunus trituberculatus TaxID=210409 RepID=A0A5B7IKU7_PORTR|nr:Solute carrier family 22 member 6 [Portunus trituberculatus]
MMACAGGIVSPFITDLVSAVYPWAPFVVFGVGASLAGVGTQLLPETQGQTLPDTVQELEERSRKRREGGGVAAAVTTLPQGLHSHHSSSLSLVV